MAYELRFARAAADALQKLAERPNTATKLKKVHKALGLLQADPLYPGLNSHLYQNFPGLEKNKVWDSYVENHTPGAWRVYWMYGPDIERDGELVSIITVLAIGPHL
ncbi:hypothetical protein NBRGN_054_00200 [Nocardia brasiliensis NBRC 14402]|uniref:hypothetical protein n=1 Tax=Nocardia brasiliensis TaxID=37326 RepID=UPI0002DD087E|nr:hypothetical protein [Nocardia brasiliensis]ASF06225.1 hypothetical protein CEQ30_01390 [Nocardia brasiliensis]GAJ82316.1 hypothetical protein NBRGN_054_00200 [Nocardia brasiliensis NBRC 14402]SUB53897.1 Uncharacterised protein [Nocardia brasiliensis]